jgi:hypothetical protein
MTGSSQLSNISYSTERSAAQSKAGSMDQTRTVETLDHARSASSVLGSAVEVVSSLHESYYILVAFVKREPNDPQHFSISQRTTWMRKDSLFLLLIMDHGLMPAQVALMTMSDQRQAGMPSFVGTWSVMNRFLRNLKANARSCTPLALLSFSQAPKMQMEIKKDTVLESNDEARAALERVASTLKQSKTVSRRHPGRREYANHIQHSRLACYEYPKG